MKAGCIFGIVVLLSIVASVSWAGSGYEVRCTDDKCAFKASIGIGGGFRFEEVSGFCRKCNDSVKITWKRGEQSKPPLLDYWDPKTGELRQIYNCPKCTEPFVVIKQIGDFKYCPKCGKPTLKATRKRFYD